MTGSRRKHLLYLTPAGLSRINHSIQAFVYCVLGSQVNVQSSILDSGGRAKEAQTVFLSLLDGAIIQPDIAKSVQRYQLAVDQGHTWRCVVLAHTLLTSLPRAARHLGSKNATFSAAFSHPEYMCFTLYPPLKPLQEIKWSDIFRPRRAKSRSWSKWQKETPNKKEPRPGGAGVSRSRREGEVTRAVRGEERLTGWDAWTTLCVWRKGNLTGFHFLSTVIYATRPEGVRE